MQENGLWSCQINGGYELGKFIHLEAAKSTAIAEMKSLTVQPDPLPQLSADYQALKEAGNAMAAAAFRVATEYDGCHRLMLAVAAWATAVANEGGRGNGG